jgi:hypothetical protein
MQTVPEVVLVLFDDDVPPVPPVPAVLVVLLVVPPVPASGLGMRSACRTPKMRSHPATLPRAIDPTHTWRNPLRGLISPLSLNEQRRREPDPCLRTIAEAWAVL